MMIRLLQMACARQGVRPVMKAVRQLVLMLLILVTGFASYGQNNVRGTWGAPITTGVEGVHAAVLPSGKVFYFPYRETDGFSITMLFTPPAIGAPNSSAVIQTMNSLDNTFCSGNSMLPDGNLLLNGGQIHQGANADASITLTNIFNWQTETFSQGPAMRNARWYPSTVQDGNGDIWTFGGQTSAAGSNDPTIERLNYSTATGTPSWTRLSGSGSNIPNQWVEAYNRVFLLGDGNFFTAGHIRQSQVYSPSQNQHYAIGNSSVNRGDGTAVRLLDGRIMIAGGFDETLGNEPVYNTAEIIDFGQSVMQNFVPGNSGTYPSWQTLPSMPRIAAFCDAIILPDGNVLVLGSDSDYPGPLTPMLYNPTANNWTDMANYTRFRGYHSTTVLLPDGRVIINGGDGNNGPGAYGETTDVQIWTPYYLYKSARPTGVTLNTPTVNYGQQVSINWTNGGSPASHVVMYRGGASTHAFVYNQRAERIDFDPGSNTGTSATFTVLNNSNSKWQGKNVFPPGYYMVFLMTQDGVPAEAQWIQIGVDSQGGGGGNPCQGVAAANPTGVSATNNNCNSISVSWSASNCATGYRVQRSTNGGSNWTTLTSNQSGTSYTDNSPNTGTNLYRVRANNSAGSNSGNVNSNTINCTPATQYSISISPSPSNGNILLNPSNGPYDAGTDVIVTATPNSGYQFTGWTGALSGSTSPATLNMNSNKTISATFALIPPSSLTAESGTVTGVGTSFTTVNLSKSFSSPVVVATPVLPSTTTAPIVTRVRNVTGSSFQVKVQNPSGASVSNITVHYFVAEAGVYNQGGVKFEAKTVTSTITGRKNGWTLEAQSYGQSYSSPVVLGQVMTNNDPNWSVFYSTSTSRTSPATSSAIRAGKHIGEGPGTTRANETVGIIIFEAGSGTVDGVSYQAGVGADNVRGPGNSTAGYTYAHSVSGADGAVLSAAGMDGGDGGWPVLLGSGVGASNIRMTFDEDQATDTERSHTTEQVAYLVTSSGSAPPPIQYTLTTNAGTGGGVTPGGTYDAGTVVQIEATPNSNFVFSNWSGSASGSTNPLNVTMNSNKSITANFSSNPCSSAPAAPTGVSVSGTCSSASVSWTASSCATSYRVQRRIGTASWTTLSGSVSGTSYTDNNPGAGVNQYRVRAQSSAGNSGNVTASGNIDCTPSGGGTWVKIDERSSAISYSGEWENASGTNAFQNTVKYTDVSGSTATYTFNGTKVAVFLWRETPQTVTIRVDGGQAQNFSVGAGSAASIRYEHTGTFSAGNHTLTVTYTSGGVHMDAIEYLSSSGSRVANPPIMTAASHELTATAENGVVQLDGEEILAGTEILLTATPDPGYQFTGWEGALEGMENPSRVLMDETKNVTANFAPLESGTWFKVDDHDAQLEMKGNWQFQVTGTPQAYLGTVNISRAGTASLDYKFTGTQARVYLLQVGLSQTVNISIDGGAKQSVTLDANFDFSSVMVWESEELADTEHTISVERVSGGVMIDAIEFKASDGLAAIAGQDGAITVYPNPVNDYTNIALPKDFEGQVKLSLYDMNGRLILEDQRVVDSSETRLQRLDLPKLEGGLYQLMLNMNGEIEVLKLIK